MFAHSVDLLLSRSQPNRYLPYACGGGRLRVVGGGSGTHGSLQGAPSSHAMRLREAHTSPVRALSAPRQRRKDVRPAAAPCSPPRPAMQAGSLPSTHLNRGVYMWAPMWTACGLRNACNDMVLASGNCKAGAVGGMGAGYRTKQRRQQRCRTVLVLIFLFKAVYWCRFSLCCYSQLSAERNLTSHKKSSTTTPLTFGFSFCAA